MIDEKTAKWKVSLFVILSLLILLALIIFVFIVSTGWQASSLLRQQATLEKPTVVYTDPLIRAANPIKPPVESIDPIRGSLNPQIQVIYFSDFLCPYCEQMSENWIKILENYGDQVQIVWKDLLTKPGSIALHKAARCAQLQGKFWEYHDRLLTYQAGQDQALSEQLISYADDVGLNQNDFTACLGNTAAEDVVFASTDQAVNLGIEVTPAYFINDDYYDGLLDYEDLETLIQEHLPQ